MDSSDISVHDETQTTSFNQNYEVYDNPAANFHDEGRTSENQFSEGSPGSQSNSTKAFDDGECYVTSFGTKKEVIEDQNEDDYKVVTKAKQDRLDVTSSHEKEIPAAFAGQFMKILCACIKNNIKNKHNYSNNYLGFDEKCKRAHLTNSYSQNIEFSQ